MIHPWLRNYRDRAQDLALDYVAALRRSV